MKSLDCVGGVDERLAEASEGGCVADVEFDVADSAVTVELSSVMDEPEIRELARLSEETRAPQISFLSTT